jgi:DNA-binding transcriptional ArsR family regulator
MAWAWRQQVGNPTRKTILLALADHADQDGICWPGHEGIAEKCEVSRRTVIRQIEQLARDGLVSVERRRGQFGRQASNRYRLRVTESHPADSRVTSTTVQSDTDDRSRVTPVSHEPSIEPSKESAAAPRVTPSHPEIEPPPTDPELHLVDSLIRAFNVEAHTRFAAATWAPDIVACLRLHPELTEAEHLRVIRAAFATQWWKREDRTRQPSPAVIWGSAKQFERTLQEADSRRQDTPAPTVSYDRHVEVIEV